MSAVGASSTSAMVMDGELREQKASGSEDFKKVVPSAAGKVSEDTYLQEGCRSDGRWVSSIHVLPLACTQAHQ